MYNPRRPPNVRDTQNPTQLAILSGSDIKRNVPLNIFDALQAFVRVSLAVSKSSSREKHFFDKDL